MGGGGGLYSDVTLSVLGSTWQKSHVDEHGKPWREAVSREEHGVPRGDRVDRRSPNIVIEHSLDGLRNPVGSVVGR